MSPVIMGNATLHLGDCIDMMRGMDDCSIDSKVIIWIEKKVKNFAVANMIKLGITLERRHRQQERRSHKLVEHGRFVEGAACRWFPRDLAQHLNLPTNP